LFSSFSFSSTDVDPNYDIVITEKVDGDVRVVKYNLHTGTSWVIQNGVFIRLHDDRVLPESTYRVVSTKHEGDWGVVKINLVSGDAWKLTGEIWVTVSGAE